MSDPNDPNCPNLGVPETWDQDPPCDCPSPETFCDLDVTNNVWVEGVVDVPAGKRGICMLDSMTKDQIVYILQHQPKAHDDLKRVTSNAELLQLERDVPVLPVLTETERQASRANKHPAGIPYYSVFKGQPPQKKKDSNQ